MRVWIDTDLGTDVDDALALAYALRHPEIDVVGVSTVFGDVALRTRMVETLLGLAGASGVPVVTGIGKPLTEGRLGRMLGHEGRGLLEDVAPVLAVESTPDASAVVDALGSAIAAAAPDWLVAIGPLTNLGALVRAEASLPPLAIMGGKVDDVMLPGMIEAIGEWNWYCDPDAARLVLGRTGADGDHADPPARVVPAEVTFQTALEEEEVERLASGGALAAALHRLCGVWLETQRDVFRSPHPHVALHDPLTAATLVEPGLCSFAHCRIEPDDTGRAPRVEGAVNAEVAVDVDAVALRARLLEAWLG